MSSVQGLVGVRRRRWLGVGHRARHPAMAEEGLGLEIFYAMDDGQISPEPASMAEMVARADAGLVKGETLVWSDGAVDSWTPVSQCADVFPELAAAVSRARGGNGGLASCFQRWIHRRCLFVFLFRFASVC